MRDYFAGMITAAIGIGIAGGTLLILQHYFPPPETHETPVVVIRDARVDELRAEVDKLRDRFEFHTEYADGHQHLPGLDDITEVSP